MFSFQQVLRRCAISAALALAAGAPLAANALEVAGRCTVQFFATSTLHDFEGTAPCAWFAVDAPDPSGRYGARVEVAIAQMDTGISARNKKMREMFEAKKFPRIVGTFASVDPAALRSGPEGALPFQLVVHGVERLVAARISDFAEVPGKSARFKASFELKLGEFGLEAPLALGFVRVGEKVKVVVEVDLAATNGVPSANPQTR